MHVLQKPLEIRDSEGHLEICKGGEVDLREARHDHHQQCQQHQVSGQLGNQDRLPLHQEIFYPVSCLRCRLVQPPQPGGVSQHQALVVKVQADQQRDTAGVVGQSQRRPVVLSPRNQPRSQKHQQPGMAHDHLRSQPALLIYPTSISIINAHF